MQLSKAYLGRSLSLVKDIILVTSAKIPYRQKLKRHQTAAYLMSEKNSRYASFKVSMSSIYDR